MAILVPLYSIRCYFYEFPLLHIPQIFLWPVGQQKCVLIYNICVNIFAGDGQQKLAINAGCWRKSIPLSLPLSLSTPLSLSLYIYIYFTVFIFPVAASPPTHFHTKIVSMYDLADTCKENLMRNTWSCFDLCDRFSYKLLWWVKEWFECYLTCKLFVLCHVMGSLCHFCRRVRVGWAVICKTFHHLDKFIPW